MPVEEKPWGSLILDDDGQMVGRIIKDRHLFAVDETMSLEPDTLVGSAFLVLQEGDVIWQGVIVGEPQAGRYLCHIDQLQNSPDVKKVQRIFSLDTLMGLGDEGRRLIEGAINSASAPVVGPDLEWRLYDSEEAATEAYKDWASATLTRELEEAQG
jgi:hypothetical protein